jgi:hypothetical protein
MESQDGITPRSDHKPTLSTGPPQGVPEEYRAAITLQQVQVIDDHRHNGATERLTDLLPQLPLVSYLRRVKTDHRGTFGSPLPQQRGFAIAGGSRNKRYGFISMSSQLEKPPTRDHAVL